MEQALVFIVRLWGTGDRAGFRAAVLRAGSNETAWFTQAEAMTRYLEGQAGVPPGEQPGKEPRSPSPDLGAPSDERAAPSFPPCSEGPSIVHTGETT